MACANELLSVSLYSPLTTRLIVLDTHKSLHPRDFAVLSLYSVNGNGENGHRRYEHTFGSGYDTTAHVSDALRYLGMIKDRFIDASDIYHNFLTIMSDTKNKM